MFVLEGVALWVINEVSNTNKQLRIIDEKNQYNMRTAEETASLALVFFVQINRALIYLSKCVWIGV